MQHEWILPIELKSPNVQEHWRSRHARNKKHSIVVRSTLNNAALSIPATIHLIRLSPRKFDDDNLVFAFKNLRDLVADILIPGHKMGMADSDKNLNWVYSQEKWPVKAVRIKIICGDNHELQRESSDRA